MAAPKFLLVKGGSAIQKRNRISWRLKPSLAGRLSQNDSDSPVIAVASRLVSPISPYQYIADIITGLAYDMTALCLHPLPGPSYQYEAA